ncbi:MAG: polyphosphate kinase 2 [Pseudomonadota bacterium]
MPKRAYQPSSLDKAVPASVVEKVSKSKKKQLIGPLYPYPRKMDRVEYEKKKEDLQVELLKMQAWVKDKGERILMIFEGRDAGGKGGTIKRFMEHLNPRQAHVIALGIPTERERGQWFFQRYISQLPTRGEMTLFDRSWYNRGIVEPVMGFCTPEQHKRFLIQAPEFEHMLIQDGFRLFKFWFSVSQEEQFRRFKSRELDRLKQWKLSPVDQDGLTRWKDTSKMKNLMFKHTDTKWAPWTVIRSDGKKRARLNCLRHVLYNVPYTGKNKKVAIAPDPKIVGSTKTMYEVS